MNTLLQDNIKIKVFWTLWEKPALTGEFRLLLWNIHKCLSGRLPADITQLLEHTDMVLFQEALLSEKWEQILSRFEGFDWGFFRGFHFPKSNIASGVMTGSRYQMQDHTIHSTTDREPILATAKSSGLSYFPIAGRTEQLLVINTHAMNFNFGRPFRKQLEDTVRMIEWHVGPMIWAGDFNTWSKWRKSFLKTIADSLGLKWITPEQDRRFLQLDHILCRGVEPLYAKVVDHISSSDHKPIIAGFRMS